ncbi:MAG: hypothetical protein ACFCVK_22715 [Acidimicrobiales bacterium]
MAEGGRRVELIDRTTNDNRPQRVGLGLLASLVVGFGPLDDAFSGNGSFEGAMFRFGVCVVGCVAAALVLGRLLDSAPPPEDEAGPDSGTAQSVDRVGDETT